MDIGGGLTVINESGILTTNTNVLRFYGDTLYSGATVTKRSDATITTDGRIELDGGDDEPRPNTELIDGGSAENDNALIDGGDET